MKVIWIIVLLANTAWTQSAAVSPSSPSKASVDQLLNALPAGYRDAARKYLRGQLSNSLFVNSIQLELDQEGDDGLEAKRDWTRVAFREMLENSEGRSFMMKRLERESDGSVRAAILKATGEVLRYDLSGHPERAWSAAELEAITGHATNDPDAIAAVAALNALHEFHVAQEGQDLATRRQQSDATELRDLYTERYAWYGTPRNPLYNYKPPPVFSAFPSGKPIRVLVFGDFGTGSKGQIKDAATMRAYHEQHPFDFGLTLGDNFYGAGLSTPEDPRWGTQWENLYGPLNIKFYPVYGNHDYIDPDSPAAELAYTAKSRSWWFPAGYYTFTAGESQFFAIDNIRLTDDELAWLDKELRRSTAKWKIVYGHYPIYSAGGDFLDHKELLGTLLPVLEKNHVQIYLNGHDHIMGEAGTDSGVHFFTSGAGGAPLYEGDPTYKRRVFKDKEFGFTVLEIDHAHVDVIFVDADGQEVYRAHITQ